MSLRRALLGLGVGLALADSSIVTLAVPEILGQFDACVSWSEIQHVIISGGTR